MHAIRVNELTKRYGSTLALDGVTFEAAPGRVTGFLGRNGAGKTTTLRILVGLASQTSGTATIGGLPYHGIDNPGRHVGAPLVHLPQLAGRVPPGRHVELIGFLEELLDARDVGVAQRRDADADMDPPKELVKGVDVRAERALRSQRRRGAASLEILVRERHDVEQPRR